MGYAKFRPRRSTELEWSLINPVLAEGELIMVLPDTGAGTGLVNMKMGDGIHHYNDLPYSFNPKMLTFEGGGIDLYNVLCIRGATREEWLKADPVLAKHELVYNSTDNSLIVGDGVSSFSELEAVGGTIYDFGDEEKMDPEETT